MPKAAATMSASRSFFLLSRRAVSTTTQARSLGTLPESIKRVGQSISFPNEYPGQNIEFNWTLNGDGVTPLKKSSFRITKALDVKVAGLTPMKNTPLKVNASSQKSSMPEAGSDALDFGTYDEVSQRTKDLLSHSATLYCPEGHMPATQTTTRIITNSEKLAPQLSAYLERAPKREPTGCAITAYVLESEELEEFSGYAIEEVGGEAEGEEVKSVAAVVCVGKDISVEKVVAGLELSLTGLKEDEEARKQEAEEKEEA